MNNAVLRARARMNLGGSLFHSDWLTALAICLVAGVLAPNFSGLSRTVDRNTYLVLSGISLLISIVVQPALTFGLNVAFLKKARGAARFEFEDLFKGFSVYGGCVALSFMQGLIVLLWFLIPIAGIYFGIKKSYSYALAMYFKVDYPDATWRECLDRSAAMMEGYRWQYFCLSFSFLGWVIVGLLCCGIGVLWVAPYENAAFANFYEARRMEGGAY